MGKKSKSKRFIKHSKDVINRHAEKFPYHLTYAEAETRKMASPHIHF